MISKCICYKCANAISCEYTHKERQHACEPDFFYFFKTNAHCCCYDPVVQKHLAAHYSNSGEKCNVRQSVRSAGVCTSEVSKHQTDCYGDCRSRNPLVCHFRKLD